jgi:hypothetical protein
MGALRQFLALPAGFLIVVLLHGDCRQALAVLARWIAQLIDVQEAARALLLLRPPPGLAWGFMDAVRPRPRGPASRRKRVLAVPAPGGTTMPRSRSTAACAMTGSRASIPAPYWFRTRTGLLCEQPILAARSRRPRAIDQR